MLADAADAARARRPDRVTPLLARVSDSADANVLTAAGRICLRRWPGHWASVCTDC